MCDYNELIGQLILGVRRENDCVVLETCSGYPDILLTPWGECCSTTWIESIDIVEPLIGGTIRNIEDIDLPSRGNVGTLEQPNVDQVSYYGLRITTDKGISVIDYRNDSNGYYGGAVDITLRDKLDAERHA